MSDLDLLALRTLAVGLAYRMLGSRTEAEDLAQDALMRLQAAAEREPLRSPEAYVTTVATRLAIDHLRLARVSREDYLGPWLPEPVADDPLADPGRAAEVSESLSYALLVVLETLTPPERAAFLLHDVFGYGYGDVARILERSPAACRQLVSRARHHLGARGTAAADVDQHRRLLERFLPAARDGDMEGLLDLLAEDVVLVSDGGPRRRAARRPIIGAVRVARFLQSVGPRLLVPGVVELTLINGGPGFLVRREDDVHLAGTIEVDGDRITALRWVLNPDKLRWVGGPG